MTAPRLAEHYFRHEYGRVVATLSRRVGEIHLEAVEDAVQSALLTALEVWAREGAPENPPAWLYRVACNRLLGDLRQGTGHRRLLGHYSLEKSDPLIDASPASFALEIQDDLLRFLFVSCDENIALESQLVLALKVLCGFNVREIALRLFTSEANVYKRLARARKRLRELPNRLQEQFGKHLETRLPAVQKVLYVLFTEGYLSSSAGSTIRRELCGEAIRLATLLAEHPVGQTPETFALLALMHLHDARSPARVDGSGGLLLLEEQDRSLWNREQMHAGFEWLSRSAAGETLTRFHAEAGIAAEHCLAPSFQETPWQRIDEGYAILERLAPSPLHTLNRAVARAEYQGPTAGLALLEERPPPDWLSESYLGGAVLADLHHRCGHVEEAERYRAAALASAPTPAVRTLLERRLRRESKA